MSRFMRYADLALMLKGMDARESHREHDLMLDLAGMPEVQGEKRPFTPELAALLYTREFHGQDRPETFTCRIKLVEITAPRPGMRAQDYEQRAWFGPVPDGIEQPPAPEWAVALVALHAPSWYPRLEDFLPPTEPPVRRLRAV